MKKSIFFLIIFSLLFSCGKEKTPATGPAAVLNSIREAETFDDLMKSYSSDTQNVMKELIAGEVLSKEQALSVLAVLQRDTLFEIAGEKTAGKRSEVTIRITAHRIENRTGMTMTFQLRLENGVWVVDMADDFRAMAEARRKSSTGEYLNRKFRDYQ